MTRYIVAQLQAHGVRCVNANATHNPNIMAYCFTGHDHKTASLSIRRRDGAFLCFGCGVKGPDWNALAKKIGAKELSEADMPDPFELLNEELDDLVRKWAAKAELPWDLEPWKGPWKRPDGIELSAGLCRAAKACLWFDNAYSVRAERILFPVWQYKKLYGWVARRLDGEKHIKYKNSPKLPAVDILYPFDLVRKLVKRRSLDTAVLVEGPFDALRLLNHGIPALALLGTHNFAVHNRVTLLNLGITRVILAMDSDPVKEDGTGAAGLLARKVIRPVLEEWFDVEDFFPPYRTDPGDMPDSAVLDLRNRALRIEDKWWED